MIYRRAQLEQKIPLKWDLVKACFADNAVK